MGESPPSWSCYIKNTSPGFLEHCTGRSSAVPFSVGPRMDGWSALRPRSSGRAFRWEARQSAGGLAPTEIAGGPAGGRWQVALGEIAGGF